jgi:hypothetical protein
MLELTNPEHQQHLKDFAASLDPIKDRIVTHRDAVINISKDGRVTTENLPKDVVHEIDAAVAALKQTA